MQKNGFLNIDNGKTVGLFILLFIVFYGVLAPFIPVLPPTGLDPSWTQVIKSGYINQWQWGKDLIFTFGPYGFLYTRLFDPGLIAETFFWWGIICFFLTSAFISRPEYKLFV